MRGVMQSGPRRWLRHAFFGWETPRMVHHGMRLIVADPIDVHEGTVLVMGHHRYVVTDVDDPAEIRVRQA